MLTLALGMMVGCGGEKKEAASKDKVTVGIVQIVEHAALDVASKGSPAAFTAGNSPRSTRVKCATASS